MEYVGLASLPHAFKTALHNMALNSISRLHSFPQNWLIIQYLFKVIKFSGCFKNSICQPKK